MSSEIASYEIVDGLLGLVLAGGKSSRIGEDKALLDFHGCPQIVFCRSILEHFCGRVYVSVRPDQGDDLIRRQEKQIPDDAQFVIPGPLAGILSAMKGHPKAAWLVVACDLPGITTGLIAELLAKRDSSKMATAFRDPDSGSPEPLCAVYEPQAFTFALDFYLSGGSCPRKFLLRSPICLLDLPTPDALFNVNTPQDKRIFFSRSSGEEL